MRSTEQIEVNQSFLQTESGSRVVLAFVCFLAVVLVVLIAPEGTSCEENANETRLIIVQVNNPLSDCHFRTCLTVTRKQMGKKQQLRDYK